MYRRILGYMNRVHHKADGQYLFSIDLLKSAGACFHKGYCCEDQICPHFAGEMYISH